jgi:hypothetical protein
VDRRHLAALPAASLFLLGTVATADVLEIPLEFHKLSALDDGYAFGSAWFEPGTGPSRSELKLPELKAEEPLFGVVELGESEFHFVVDASKGGDGHLDRLYFDRGGDLDLTNDPALRGQVWRFDEEFYTVDFDRDLEVEYVLDGQRLPYVLSVSVQGQDMSRFGDELPEGFEAGWNVYAYINTGCLYEGEVQLGGERLRLRLTDSDVDGVFGEVAYMDDDVRFGGDLLYPRGDGLHLTRAKEFTYRDRMVMGDHLIAGESVFAVAVDTAAARILLAPLTEGLKPLSLAFEPERLAIHSKGFEHTIVMLDPGTTAQVPAGEYRLLNYTLKKEGEYGDVWRVDAGATMRSPFVEVGGGDAKLPFGEPYAVGAEVPEWYREQFDSGESDEVEISLTIHGSGNESVQDLARVSGRRSACEMSGEDSTLPAEPKYVIVRSTGEQVTRGTFEYG